MSSVNRGRRGAVIHECQPTRIAVGQDIDRFSRLFIGDLSNDLQPMLANLSTELRVFVSDFLGRSSSCVDFSFYFACFANGV